MVSIKECVMKAEQLSFGPKDIVFREGEESKGIYIIQEGRVEIFKKREDVEVIVSEMTAGEVIGIVSLFSKDPLTSSARASTNVVLGFYNTRKLDEELKTMPVWVQAVIKDAVARLRGVIEKLIEMKVQEKTQHSKDSVYQNGAQFANLMSVLSRAGTVTTEEGIPVFPLKGVIAHAEGILAP
jgi:CRP/FNR family transcriptional regulator, cyclic AMP receptor protein